MESGRRDTLGASSGSAGLVDSDLQDQVEGHETQNELVRKGVLLARMQEVLATHQSRALPSPGPTPTRGNHAMGLSIPLDLDDYLLAEVRRLNGDLGLRYSGRVTRTDLIKQALDIRLPDLDLYDQFASVVIRRRKAVGVREIHLKVPIATADALCEIGVAVPGRPRALAPKAVAEALVYAWATIYAENPFTLPSLPEPRGRRPKAK